MTIQIKYQPRNHVNRSFKKSKSDPDNCKHIQSECEAKNLLKITEIVDDSSKQFPETLPSTMGLTDLFSFECDDPLDKARFCRYKNMCIFNQWTNGFFSAPYTTNFTLWDLTYPNKKDLRVSQYWFLHPLVSEPRIVP